MKRDLRRAEEQSQRLEQIETQLESQAQLISHLATMARSVEITQAHSGPLPAPSTLTEYQAHPEVYDALIARFKQETAMLKDEQDHRHALDRFNFRIAAWGVGLGWTLMFACFVSAVTFVVKGVPVAGLVSAIVAMGALAGNLLYARNKPPQVQSPAEEKGGG